MTPTRFSMKEWKPPTIDEKIFDAEQRANEIEDRKRPLVDRKKELELELSELNAKVRIGGLHDVEYNHLCKRQTEIKQEKYNIEKEMLKLNDEKREISKEKDVLYFKNKKQPKDVIITQMSELRDKYTSFAADRTRVSSMRAMAAAFVEEIQSILNVV